MNARFGSTATLLALAALSVGSFLLVETEAASLVVGLAAVAIALVKAALILNRFMHLEWRHRPFTPLLVAWLGIVGVILGGGLGALPWKAPAPIPVAVNDRALPFEIIK